MGVLRDRMFANMRMRNFSPKTIKAYLWHVTEFTKYFGKSPDLLGEEEVRLCSYPAPLFCNPFTGARR